MDESRVLRRIKKEDLLKLEKRNCSDLTFYPHSNQNTSPHIFYLPKLKNKHFKNQNSNYFFKFTKV